MTDFFVGFALGVILGVVVSALAVVLALVRYAREGLERIISSSASRPRAPRQSMKREEPQPALPFSNTPPLKGPRTNFTPTPETISLRKPSMRTYLTNLQRKEAGPLVEAPR